MSKYNNITYCVSCGSANAWSFSKKGSLLNKPKFCSSCGCNLITGKITKKKKELQEVEEEAMEDEDVVISTDIPPLELDEAGCFFPQVDSQSLGNLVAPVLKEEEE
jgi:hypothetical protein